MSARTEVDARANRIGDVDAVVVGAGFAGLYAVHKLRSLGLTVQGVEAAGGVGGTWFWNRYPGARCDVESVDYSYSFSRELEQEWDWSEKYATQPEILAYINHVADRFDLRDRFLFGTRVTSAELDEETLRWEVRTDRGDVLSARYCIFATGALSTANTPKIPGRESFTGDTHHTGQWPHEGVDFTGRRVGIIGTGSSGIQSIPLIAEQAEHLYVFQRSANYSVPAGNQTWDDEMRRAIKAGYDERRRLSRESGGGSPYNTHPKSALEVSDEERRDAYETRWKLGGVLFAKTFPDQTKTEAANATARQFAEEKIRLLVDDPAVADKLIPNDHPIGTKRIVTDTHYFETYNRPNVTLVDLKAAPIESISPSGITTADADYALDTLVFATGFDAMTGALDRMRIVGRGGVSLSEYWSEGPKTYLGLGVPGFPNLFVVTGPGSPSVLANMVLGAEQHVDWIADCIEHLWEKGHDAIEASVPATEQWVEHCRELAAQTLFPLANSWYMGANIPGKPRVFMPYLGGFGAYGRICADVAEEGFRGFEFSRSRARLADPVG
ncbi:steroid monooxygenase [Rhodococcus opacus RKJ300 = JCM 13270]|uniref:Steroid monooxygenase n=1 Tax=Rhodococcus opacus RKJ300 = JCM 13270 TaxID=1165867 RepID=I0WSN6_RHOOP|nr:steroid monooxygenase [Rhodococcus opacus RKJ300 = JCM 13270]